VCGHSATLSTRACDAPAGRLERQPQAGLSAVSDRGPVAAAQAAEAQQVGQAAPPKRLVSAINEIWSMDFVSDALFDGRRLRALTMVDTYTRECLAIEVGQSLKGEDVVRTLEHITGQRGWPGAIKARSSSRRR
jgi:transposase InsO family protein